MAHFEDLSPTKRATRSGQKGHVSRTVSLCHMTYFKDLSDYSYFGDSARPETKNIGWLERGQEFDRTAPSDETLDLLWTFCTISAAQSRGRHACDLCTPSTFASGERNGISLSLGSSEIRVFSPAGTIIYAAPTLIFHYVSIHHYQPPEDFLQALREGPKPPVLEYFGQLSSIDPQWNRTSTTDPVQGYLEGLRIYRELGKTNPGYLPYVADSLFELGIYDASHDREKAKQFYEEALEIYRHLAKGNSAKYLARVAKILIRLGDLYGLTQRPKKAEEAYQEALTIYRELVAGSPDYLIFVSSALNQLARLYKAAGRVRDSADASEEALKIRQEWQAAKLQIPWH